MGKWRNSTDKYTFGTTKHSTLAAVMVDVSSAAGEIHWKNWLCSGASERVQRIHHTHPTDGGGISSKNRSRTHIYTRHASGHASATVRRMKWRDICAPTHTLALAHIQLGIANIYAWCNAIRPSNEYHKLCTAHTRPCSLTIQPHLKFVI